MSLSSLLLFVLAFIAFPACAADAASGSPKIIITEPLNGSEIAVGNVNISVAVENFSVVDKLGKPSVAGEGHIHYFMDAKAATTPGKPAITKLGTYAPTINKSHTWKNVTAGKHNFSVELVNNDHTPLSPPVVAEVNVTAKAANLKTMSVENVTIALVAQGMAFNTSKITVPAGAHVTINFDNQDSGIPHNLAVYETSSAEKVIFQGKRITGPSKTTYVFDAPTKAGTYFFRCDVHPTMMTGDFIVK
jgi:plastocyanin